MKRLVKTMLRTAWNWTRPMRRPFVNKFHRFLERSLEQSGRQLTDETNLLMNHVVRELVRLQRQVEELQETVERLADSEAPLTVVRAVEDESAHFRAG